MKKIICFTWFFVLIAAFFVGTEVFALSEITEPGEDNGQFSWETFEENRYTVSGTVTSFTDHEAVITVALFAAPEEPAVYSVTVFGNSAAYSIENVAPGTYTAKVSKANHVTRAYTITVADANVFCDMKIHPAGDITGDGKITVLDVGRANSHAMGVSVLTGYDLACADVWGSNGQVTAVDVARINSHAKGTSLLW